MRRSSSAQSQLAQSHALTVGTTIPAMLDKSKIGDEITAQTAESVNEGGETIIPKASKIVGHVIEAKSRTSDDHNSILGSTFDHAALKKGGGTVTGGDPSSRFRTAIPASHRRS